MESQVPLFHPAYTFEGKNEQAIREELVRPFLDELGYKLGSETLVRYEVPLRYAYHFLGRKKPGKDIKIEGRSDYIIEVIPSGRWVIEAKPSNEELTVEDSYQAHTYAAHPEIAATLYLITNGKKWKLFRTSFPENPIAEWSYENLDEMAQKLQNVLSPAAIRRLNKFEIDLSKPIVKGLRSELEIKTGYVVYEEHRFQHSIFAKGSQEGIQNGITGNCVTRTEGGEIVASVSFLSAYGTMQEYFSAMGIDEMEFRTSDEFISKNINLPTVFTNLTHVAVPAGTLFPTEIRSKEKVPSPFAIKAEMFSQAVGFIEDSHFQGTFHQKIDFFLDFGVNRRMLMNHLPERTWAEVDGRFSLIVR